MEVRPPRVPQTRAATTDGRSALKLGNNSRRDYTPLPRLDRSANTDYDEDLEEVAELPEETAAPAVNSAATRAYDFIQPRNDGPGTDNPALAEDCSSVIGSGSAWQGTLVTDGSIRLEGKVNGEVKAAGTIHVTEGADVNATMHAKFVVIAGSFDGKLFCSDRLELRPTSKVRGAITTRSLSVGEGSFIDGEIHMTDQVPDIFAGEPVAVAATAGNGNGSKR